MQIFKLNWKSDLDQGNCDCRTHLVVYLAWFKVQLCDQVSMVLTHTKQHLFDEIFAY